MFLRRLLILTLAAVFYNAFPAISASRTSEYKMDPSVRLLLAKLYSPNEKDRISAAVKLADHNSEEVIDSLIDVLNNDNNEMVKRVAVKSLGALSAAKAIPMIISIIKDDSNIPLKLEAMMAGSSFDDKKIVDELLLQFKSANPIVRQKAVIALANMYVPESVLEDVLTKSLDDINEGVRVSALRALKVKTIKSMLKKISYMITEDPSEVVRLAAVESSAEASSEVITDALANALKDTSPYVRSQAAFQLALKGETLGFDEAIKGIKSPEPKIRILSCKVMGIIGDKSALVFLRQAMDDFDIRVQKAAAAAEKAIMKSELIR